MNSKINFKSMYFIREFISMAFRHFRKPLSEYLNTRLCMMFCLFFCYLPGYGQENIQLPITLSIKDKTLKEVFKTLEQKTGFTINYQDNVINTSQKVSLEVNHKPFAEVLTQLLSGSQVSFKQQGSMIVLMKQTTPTAPPSNGAGRLTGKVIDEENGQAVVGATIRIGTIGTTSNMDGTFSLPLSQGSYTATVSYIGYGTKEINEIVIKDHQPFHLNITLKRKKGQLADVIVRASASKESIASFYSRQKNAATVTDGISFEQLNKLPDNNVGAVLKRISGVSVVDNKYVVVRGMTERYNQAMMDGMVLPSTDANKRNFSFDLIPNEMVGEILVNKTATPDASAEFVGGQVIIKTLDIPTKNFTTISIGESINSQTVGRDFYYLGKRQSGDYFTIENGNRKIPDNAVSWSMANQQEDPTQLVISPNGYKYGYEGAIEQSKRFNPDGFRHYKTTANPNLNLKYIMGRVYQLDTAQNKKLGFTGGITYRNRTQTDEYKTTRGLGVGSDYFSSDSIGTGNIYSFSTSATALLNAGISSNGHKVTIRNLYSRNFTEDYYRSLEFNNDMSSGKQQTSLVMPVLTSIQQHKLEGEHRLTPQGLQVSWMLGYAAMHQSYNDVRSFQYGPVVNSLGEYYQASLPGSNGATQAAWSWPYRLWSDVKQKDYTWGIDFSQPFNFLQGKSILKTGYNGWDKKRHQSLDIFKVYTAYRKLDVEYLPYHIQMDADHVGVNKGQTYYWGDLENGDQASSTSDYHAAYLMLDQRISKLRLVYGFRAENFGLANKQLGEVRRIEQFKKEHPNTTYNGEYPLLTGEKNWNFLPSANLTYSITSKINLRAAYSQTMIRPTFRETSVTAFPDPSLNAAISGGNISSTKIENKDLRFEWYPKPGDMLSVSVFHKHLDKPVELVVNSINTSPISMYYRNQHDATSKGVEMEFRKNLNFISPLLKGLTFYGNGAYFASKVNTINVVKDPADANKTIEVIKELERPLMGQSPYLVNLGLLYEENGCSGNVVFNRTGYRPNFAVDGNPGLSEFKAAFSQLDLQLSKKLFHNKGEFKLNVTNLLNQEEFYYRNIKGYQGGFVNGKYQIVKMKYYFPAESYFPPVDGNNEYRFSDFTKLTDNYSAQQGDQKTYSIRRGINMSLSFSYNF